MAPAEMNNSQLRNEIKQIKDILSLNEHPESAAHLYLNQLNKELKSRRSLKSFKNKNLINHLIQIKSGNHPSIDYEENSGLSPMDWSYIFRNYPEEDFEDMLFGFDYYESMIGKNRAISQKVYKKMMHDIRKEEFEMDSSMGSRYEPDYNPGGGPYHFEDNK